MTDAALAAPFECPLRTVEHEWVDYNGHLNMAYYHVLFDQSLDKLFDEFGIGWSYTKQGDGSCFTAEVHVCYLDELLEGDPVRITYQILDADAKRVHVFGYMYHAEKGYLAATSEQMCIHVDMKTRRASPFPEEAQRRIVAGAKAHAGMARPEQAGRVIGIKRK